ncbi:DUF2407 C-terminal domain-containing protein [Phyllosticta citribraziliensis]|uniref:DUF2407 C-terminal domain-containing protein n=1 Tax=Phyllosticta citribraziliensis TaxID=989973 RepID=A0ABR1M9I9_9PEZI
MADALPPDLILIVRFTASIPDLPLPIHNPKTTTALSLKQSIRQHLPATHASSRLRLIHAGKVLADTAPLTSSLSLPPPPPPRAKPPDTSSTDAGKGKGKGKDRAPDDAPPEPRKLYIHCSIGDTLTSSQLTAEKNDAASAEAALTAAFTSGAPRPQAGSLTGAGSSSAVDESTSCAAGDAASSTTAAPQGFDRLLSAGFTAAEVAALRSQFRANLSFTHTPDTMPSAAEMRVLEDRWLDNDNANRPVGVEDGAGGDGGGDAAGGGWGSATWSDNGGLDDMLHGNVVGFFWPLGALGWGFREEGVWSRRRQIAVLTGFLLNIIFGFLRLTS